MEEFYVPIDMHGLEIRNHRMHLLASDPGTPSEGDLWWNTTDHVARVRDNTEVRNLFNADDDFYNRLDPKVTIADADEILLADSEDTFNYKRMTKANLIAGLSVVNDAYTQIYPDAGISPLDASGADLLRLYADGVILSMVGSQPAGDNQIDLTWEDQAINLVLASPDSGSAGPPVFRILVDDDMPTSYNATNWDSAYSHSQISSGNPHNVTLAELGYGNYLSRQDSVPPYYLYPSVTTDELHIDVIAEYTLDAGVTIDGVLLQDDEMSMDYLGPPAGDWMMNLANKQLKFTWVAPVTADGALELEVTGAFTGDVLHIHQHTGNPGAGTHLLHLEAEDADVTPLYVQSVPKVADFVRAGTGTASMVGISEFTQESSSDAVDGFGAAILFSGIDSDTTRYRYAIIGGRRSGADDNGELLLQVYDNGVIEDVFTAIGGGPAKLYYDDSPVFLTSSTGILTDTIDERTTDAGITLSSFCYVDKSTNTGYVQVSGVSGISGLYISSSYDPTVAFYNGAEATVLRLDSFASASTDTDKRVIYIRRMTNSSAVAGYGGHMQWDLDNGAGDIENVTNWGVRWTDVTATTEDAEVYFETMYDGVMYESVLITGLGLTVTGDATPLDVRRDVDTVGWGVAESMVLKNSSDQWHTYAAMYGVIADDTVGAEGGRLSFQVATTSDSGSLNEILRIAETGTFTNNIAELTTDAGVTVEGILLKDTTIQAYAAASTTVLDLRGRYSYFRSSGGEDRVTIQHGNDGNDAYMTLYDNAQAPKVVLNTGSESLFVTGIKSNTLDEYTSGFGVTIEGIRFEDSYINFPSAVDIRENDLQAIHIDVDSTYNIRIGNTGWTGSGTNNILMGLNAGTSLTSGGANVLIGNYAGDALLDDSNNVAIGVHSLGTYANNYGVAIGAYALQLATGVYNLAVGPYALNKVVGSAYNVALGAFAGRYTLGANNIFIGYNAGLGVDGVSIGNNNNVFIGLNSGKGITTGDSNFGLGINTLSLITSGLSNFGIGSNSLTKITTESYNVAIGEGAGRYTIAPNNTFIGVFAGYGVDTQSTGGYNVMIGYGTGSGVTTGTYNLLIGYDIDLDSATDSYVFRMGWSNTFILEGDMTAASEWVGTDYEFRSDIINEFTTDAGVTIEGVKFEDFGAQIGSATSTYAYLIDSSGIFGPNNTDLVMAPQTTGAAVGKNVIIRGGYAGSGDNDGGNVYIYEGAKSGTGSDGQLYFGTGAAGALLNDEAETNLVAYDTTTGLLTYRSAASLGGGDVTANAYTEFDLAVWDNTAKDLTDTGGSITFGSNIFRVAASGGMLVTDTAATTPAKLLDVIFANTDTTLTTGLSGGGGTEGMILHNSQATTNVFANLDFRANGADGRIAYQMTAANVGKFHFIAEDGGGSTFDTMITATGAGDVTLAYAGTDVFATKSDGVAVNATGKVYFDGGTHTYLYEQADDVVRMMVGAGGLRMEWGTSYISLYTVLDVRDVSIVSTTGALTLGAFTGYDAILNAGEETSGTAGNAVLSAGDASAGTDGYIEFRTGVGIYNQSATKANVLYFDTATGYVSYGAAVAYGADNQIPVMNGTTAFDYNAALTYASGTLQVGSTATAGTVNISATTNTDTTLKMSSGSGIFNMTWNQDNGDLVFDVGGTATLAKFLADGANEFYYNNNKKLETLTDGIEVTGKIYAPTLADETGDYFVKYEDTASEGEIVYDSSSDEKLKKNIRPWKFDSLSLLNSLDIKMFDRRYGHKKKGVIGWIAQDLQLLMPDMVGESKQGYLTIKEPWFQRHFHRAIIQIDQKVETQEQKIIRLEERIDELEKQLKSA